MFKIIVRRIFFRDYKKIIIIKNGEKIFEKINTQGRSNKISDGKRALKYSDFKKSWYPRINN